MPFVNRPQEPGGGEATSNGGKPPLMLAAVASGSARAGTSAALEGTGEVGARKVLGAAQPSRAPWAVLSEEAGVLRLRPKLTGSPSQTSGAWARTKSRTAVAYSGSSGAGVAAFSVASGAGKVLPLT